MFPFTQIGTGNNVIRKFSKNTEAEELIWHRDKEDRMVEVIQSDGWYFQFDEELPIALNPGDKIFIPREKWHRLMRRKNNDLILMIRMI